MATSSGEAMDLCAELTLQVVHLAQEHRRSRRSLQGWLFVPEFRRATWDDARTILAAVAKPIIVAPLIEPGYLAVWSMPSLDAMHRAAAEANHRQREEYFTEKLHACGLGDSDTIRLEAGPTKLALSVGDFRRWYREYAVAVGVTLESPGESGVGRVLVRVPGGGAEPIGSVGEDRAAAT